MIKFAAGFVIGCHVGMRYKPEIIRILENLQAKVQLAGLLLHDNPELRDL